MAKHHSGTVPSNANRAVDHGRGHIRHNAIEALVTSVVFRSKVEKPKKGKGAYSRKQNRQGHLQGAPDAFWH